MTRVISMYKKGMARRLLLRTASLVLFITACVMAREITLVADYWMPFNGDGTNEIGYMVELARKVFPSHGVPVKYTVISWHKAVERARIGKYDGVIGAYKGDVPDFIYPQNEQGKGYNEFFVKKGNSWRYASLQSLLNVKIGVILGYSYNTALDKYVKKYSRDSSRIKMGMGEDAIKNNFFKLLLGKTDVVIENNAVATFTIHSMGIQDSVVSAGRADSAQPIYIAFSPAISDGANLAKILSDAMVDLRKSGELSAILSRYGLKDWK